MNATAETTMLICQECGHREEETPERTFMLRVRMWNHMQHEHPDVLAHIAGAHTNVQKNPEWIFG